MSSHLPLERVLASDDKVDETPNVIETQDAMSGSNVAYRCTGKLPPWLG